MPSEQRQRSGNGGDRLPVFGQFAQKRDQRGAFGRGFPGQKTLVEFACPAICRTKRFLALRGEKQELPSPVARIALALYEPTLFESADHVGHGRSVQRNRRGQRALIVARLTVDGVEHRELRAGEGAVDVPNPRGEIRLVESACQVTGRLCQLRRCGRGGGAGLGCVGDGSTVDHVAMIVLLCFAPIAPPGAVGYAGNFLLTRKFRQRLDGAGVSGE